MDQYRNHTQENTEQDRPLSCLIAQSDAQAASEENHSCQDTEPTFEDKPVGHHLLDELVGKEMLGP